MVYWGKRKRRKRGRSMKAENEKRKSRRNIKNRNIGTSDNRKLADLKQILIYFFVSFTG